MPTSIGVDLPAARSGHSAVWTGQEMIVWGGAGGVYMNSGGRYTPASDSWAPTSTGAGLPAPRSGHTVVWTDSRMIVWGGVNTLSGFLNTGGVYDPSLDSWTATSTGANVPSARGDHTAVWTGSEMIVWGGGVAGVVILNTGRRYNPATDTWALVSTGTNTPSARFNHSAVWTGTEMLVWGGDGGIPNLNTGARYHPPSDTWIPIVTGAGVPGARFGHTAVWTGSEMIVWGGTDGSASLDTGGRYDPATETWAPTSTGTGVPSARSSYAAVWTGSEMILWGGYSEASGYLNSGGRYEPSTDSWLATTTGGPVPDARSDLVAVWTGQKAIFWGGYSPGSGYTNTGGLYDPSADAWAPTSLGPGLPGGRGGSTAVWTGTEMIVWGGYDANLRLNTGGRYDPAAEAWAPTSPPADVPGRYAHTAVWTGTEMIVWGGYNGSSLNDGGRYDPALDTWSLTSTFDPVPVPRSGHTAVWDGSGMIVWGGLPIVNTGGRYDPANDIWSPTATDSNVPSPRSAQAAVWTGREMIVWGGFDGAYPVTGGRYDPAADAWTPTATGANLPVGRIAHQPIWTGREMIVWGDANGEDLRSGAAYCACPDGLLYYRDQDGDGYGDPVFAWPSCDGTMPEGYAANAGDCDDADASTHPDAEETCNGADENCNGVADDVTLLVSRSERSTVVAWSSVVGGGGYDVVRGNLLTLNATGGDFAAAVDACLADDTDLTSMEEPDDPQAGEAVFYLVRTAACARTWNSGGPAQQGDRDPEIAASLAACP
jgi:N-acetylneuraminic acid mutarotase